MDVLSELERVTDRLTQFVEKPIASKDRDQVLEDIERCLDRRQELIDHIKPPFTEAESKLGATILEKDQQIQLKLNHLFLELKSDMRHAKKQQFSTKKYIDPYRQVATNDGSYWDKKK